VVDVAVTMGAMGVDMHQPNSNSDGPGCIAPIPAPGLSY
jgi:hypothetical protein